MDKASVERFLRAAGSQPTGMTSSGWVIAPCPLAPWKHKGGVDAHPSFAVQVGKESRFNCFSCGSGGDLSYMILLLTHLGADPQKYDFGTLTRLVELEESQPISLDIKDFGTKPDDGVVTPWPEGYLQNMPPVHQVPQAMEYLKSRGVYGCTASLLDLRWSISRMVCFPIRDFSGNLTGLRGRRVSPQDGESKYYVYRYNQHSNSDVWLGEHWLDFDKPVLLVESVFDLAAVFPVYSNVAAPMTATFNTRKAHRLLDNCRDVVTLFDADTAGDRARAKIAGTVGGGVLLRQLCPPEGYKDPGAMPLDEIRDLLLDVLPVRT